MDENIGAPAPQLSPDSCQELQEMLPAYVTGTLNQEEMARIEWLFEKCPEAKGELKDYAAVMVGFLERVQPVQPPASVLQDILNVVQETKPSRTLDDINPSRHVGTR